MVLLKAFFVVTYTSISYYCALFMSWCFLDNFLSDSTSKSYCPKLTLIK